MIRQILKIEDFMDIAMNDAARNTRYKCMSYDKYTRGLRLFGMLAALFSLFSGNQGMHSYTTRRRL